jgi:hypothetical protein
MSMTYADLVRFERRLRHQSILSVYVRGEHGGNPAQRDAWRTELRHAFEDIESWLEGSSHSDREAFAAARQLALSHLDTLPSGVTAPGWAGFFGPGQAEYVGFLPAPAPTMAVWSTGASVAPYLRSLKEAQLTVVALADHRSVRLYSYRNRVLELLESVRPRVVLEPPSHLGRPPRAGFHTGTRGRTGADAAQRELQKGTERMLGEAASRIAALEAGQAWVVIGGNATVASALVARLSPDSGSRALVVDGLDVHATTAQIEAIARDASSRLRTRLQSSEVEVAVSGAASGGLGVTGSVDTLRVLEEGRGRDVYLSNRFLENSAAAAEAVVRRAFDAGCVVQHVSGEAASRLDEVGGIAARLRYVVPQATT